MGVDSCLENVWAVAATVSHLVNEDYDGQEHQAWR